LLYREGEEAGREGESEEEYGGQRRNRLRLERGIILALDLDDAHGEGREVVCVAVYVSVASWFG
jgi:hypothetical protein